MDEQPEPQEDGSHMTPPPTPAEESVYQKPQKPNIGAILGTVLLFIILFFVGFWLSGILRQYMGNIPFLGKTQTPTPSQAPLFGTTPSPTEVSSLWKNWKTYQVLNGLTRAAFAGLTFKLPPDILAPICDGTACASQGTYLPGGTRLTVALRGEGQVLPDYRGRIISDLSGKSFVSKESSLPFGQATEFIGDFSGTTVGGYAFSRMRGYMIELSDTVSLEINHFTPSGINADFISDETVFNTIVESIVLPLSPIASQTATPTQGTFPSSTPSSTPVIMQ